MWWGLGTNGLKSLLVEWIYPEFKIYLKGYQVKDVFAICNCLSNLHIYTSKLSEPLPSASSDF